MLSSIGHALDPDVDAVALHYRHLGVSIVKQLRQGRPIEDILLDRARGYCVSRNDPVTGGVHCAIGSRVSGQDLRTGSGDYVVTSTLASQCPPAVGRALGFSVASKLLQRPAHDKPSTRPISFVSIGDGSMHNAHFLSAFNLARHARYRRIKCPVVFGISDNGMSISYKTDGYTRSLFNLRGDEIPMWSANGTDMLDVYDKTLRATEYSRKKAAPSLLLYKDITRRFGHAATDRQHAYLSEDEVLGMAESDVISAAVVQAVEQQNVGTYAEWLDRFEEIGSVATKAFDAASMEPKITDREDMLSIVSQPMVPVPRLPEAKIVESADRTQKTSSKRKGSKAEVMRKHMTKVIAETLEKYPDCVYIGEDVEHGGYYLVTDGLAEKFPGRIIDFPPDETTLLGAAIGYSQAGLTPIIEVPYAKYLDCGVDTFYELAISNWLTNGQRPNGMIVRVQGFDRGRFGGNSHTHNMISHIPPGVDAVCYSNGRDYARGFRNAIKQARAGRVVVFIDCTNLLNLRHLHDRDRGWETPYPPDEDGEIMGFDDVRTHSGSGDGREEGRYAIVTYGNGVVTALQARKAMISRIEMELDVIDCPYLSDVPIGLKEVIGQYKGVLFADICKEGPGSNVLSPMISQLKAENSLPNNWEFVAAPRTYNPLGNTITFLSQEDIIDAFGRIVARDGASNDETGSHKLETQAAV